MADGSDTVNSHTGNSLTLTHSTFLIFKTIEIFFFYIGKDLVKVYQHIYNNAY